MENLKPKDLLLSPALKPEQVQSILAPFGFKEIKKADNNLQIIADEPRTRYLLAEVIEDLLDSFSKSADPDQALNFFERFVRATYNKTNFFSYLKASPFTLWLLAKLLSSSPFLTEILIRNPTYLYWIADPKTMEEEKSKTALENDLNSSLRILKTREKKIETLCIFKRKELLRIGVRDLLKKTSVQKTTAALSMLAETILQKIYEICDEKMQTQFGEPRFLRKKPNKRKRGFTILGMGKLGGGELNFSSDIDLIYMYESEEGWTSGQTSKGEKSKISHHEYFRKLSQEITSILTGVTNEGTLYRVDLRLRPEGRSGPVANSLKAYLTYYENRGSTWERLALLKARPVAGDSILGLQFLKKVSPFIFQKSFSLTHLQEVKTLKDKIDHTIKKRGETQTNVKLGTGGIREIEFMVQTLQIFFGSNFKKICHRNTQTSLKKLLREKFISKETYNDLNHAYIFLRNAEHRLQMVHESQTHNLPQDLTELRICALRLDYRDQKGISASDQFLRNYKTHTERVHRLFRKLFDPPHVSLKGPSKGNPLL